MRYPLRIFLVGCFYLAGGTMKIFQAVAGPGIPRKNRRVVITMRSALTTSRYELISGSVSVSRSAAKLSTAILMNLGFSMMLAGCSCVRPVFITV